MIIAVDVDDTTVNMIDELLRIYNKDYNDNLKKSDVTDWDLSQFVKPECGKHILDYFEDGHLYDNVKPIKGAYEGIATLRSCGARIVYVTSVFIGHAGRKFQLLKQYGFVNDQKDYVECSDKSLIKADIMIDDNYNNVKNFENFSIMYRQPWNEKYQHGSVANNWPEVLRMIARYYEDKLSV